MSEIDKHYGGEDAADRPAPRAARGSARSPDAAETVRRVRAEAEDTADRLRDTASDAYERAQDWAHDSYDTLSRNAVYARRRGAAEFNRGRRTVAAFVDENPIMVGVAGLAVGLLVGAMLPGTRRENRLMGPYADDMRRQGVRYARDAAHQGREAISENLEAITRPARRERD